VCKAFLLPSVSQCFQAPHPLQDEFHQVFCPWDVFEVIQQTSVCPVGRRLMPHDTTVHHFLLFQRVVLAFIGTSNWLFFPYYISEIRKLEENMKMEKKQNMEIASMWPAKLLLPFSPPTKAYLSPCWKLLHIKCSLFAFFSTLRCIGHPFVAPSPEQGCGLLFVS